MAELRALKERQFALGASVATSDAVPAGLPWACEACMALGNTEARCRVCNGWRCDEDRQKFLAEQRERKQAELERETERETARRAETDTETDSGAEDADSVDKRPVPARAATRPRQSTAGHDEELLTERQPRRARRKRDDLPLARGADKQQGQALYEAIKRNDLDGATAALSAGATVTQDLSGLSGWTALHLAAKAGHVALCELFVERGADLEARDSFNGLTALHSASSYGHTEVVALLLRQSVDPNGADSDGHTPLMLSSQYGQMDVIRQLVAEVAQAHDRHAAQAKLDASPSPELQPEHKPEPAVGQLQAAEQLITKETDEELEVLIGAATYLVDRITRMAFQIVAEPAPAATEVGVWDNTQRMIVFHHAFAVSQTASVSGSELPVRVVSLNAQNIRGDTALHIAAKWGQVEAFEYLLAVGADAELKNDAGKRATDIMTPQKLQDALLCVPPLNPVEFRYRPDVCALSVRPQTVTVYVDLDWQCLCCQATKACGRGAS